MADGNDDHWEAVSPAGCLYRVPKTRAREFARHFEIKDDQNFPRALNPADTVHQFCEDWQAVVRVHVR